MARVLTLSVLNIPDGTGLRVPQKDPVVGHGQRGAVGHGDGSAIPREVEHAAKVHRGGGEVEVGEVDLGVQPHRVLLRVSQVVDLKYLGGITCQRRRRTHDIYSSVPPGEGSSSVALLKVSSLFSL